ncbi:hypothetical protein GCM10008171_11080 [Methylopila jiangsuensis]|uniref:Sec-independent protein translocase protein TatB n=1 Tax=Methylopila jiangsuensis TaxID=586230 RepID=A0A9W6JH03_9HYPH|nr:Sec-independent protein translocase protein TatB [Methylopila jiangsuensis]MDR6286096.1 sec-independent protein translocase protein TatB [Methylopila jiangsuensis]GLK75854.1 hypothetical protein GCM10008171_11080 [Methylopila jiangsuensis]
MFDIAWSEFLIVAVVALVVVGPRDLPGLLRNVGRMVATVRRMAGEFQTQFNDAMREAELDELRKEVSGLKDVASKAMGGDPMALARDELRKAIDGKPADSAPSALAGDGPAAAPAEEGVPSALAPPAPEAGPENVSADAAPAVPAPAEAAPGSASPAASTASDKPGAAS